MTMRAWRGKKWNKRLMIVSWSSYYSLKQWIYKDGMQVQPLSTHCKVKDVSPINITCVTFNVQLSRA